MRTKTHSLRSTSGKSTLTTPRALPSAARSEPRLEPSVRVVQLGRQASSQTKTSRTSCRGKDRHHRSCDNHTRRHRASNIRRTRASSVQARKGQPLCPPDRQSQPLQEVKSITPGLQLQELRSLAPRQTYSTRSRYRRSTRRWVPRSMTLEALAQHLSSRREPRYGRVRTMIYGTKTTDLSKSRRASRKIP